MSNKYDIQINIINTLSNGLRTTYLVIACEFVVSIQTIKKDINELSLHFPIITFVGKHGGVEINKGYIKNGFIMKTQYVYLIISALHILKSSINDPNIDILLKLLSK